MKIEKESQELAYRVYVTDALKCIGALNRRYYDVIEQSKVNNEPQESAEDVINRIKGKLGGEVK